MKLKIPFLNKEETTKVFELEFSEDTIKENKIEALLQTIRVSFSNIRRARAVTQGKGSVRGGGRKPYRQKGTGRARQGSIRNPHFVGGGVAHGPRVRNWALKIPRKVAKNVFCYLLHKKVKDNKVFLLNDTTYLKSPSLKKFKALLDKEFKNVLIVATSNSNLDKSSRNLKQVFLRSATSVTPFDILKSDIIILSTSIVPNLQARL